MRGGEIPLLDWKLEREASVNDDGIDAFQNLNGLSKSDGWKGHIPAWLHSAGFTYGMGFAYEIV